MDIQSLSGPIIYIVTFLIIFSESGFFFLFFLPGDSLLFALGLLANQGQINIFYILALLVVAAILGNFVGYYLGKITRGGLERGKYLPKVKEEHLKRAEVFYQKYGIWATLFARFIPIIRTFVPFFAGIVSMNRKVFSFWTIVGGIFWVCAITLVGYFFGREFNIEKVAYLGTFVILVAAVATPVFIGLVKRYLK